MNIHSSRLVSIVVLVSFLVLSAAGSALAIPLMLNNVPTTDITPHNTLVLMTSYYGYKYKTPQAFPTKSMVYSAEYGYKKLELGFDYTADRLFVDNGGYPGKMAWNAKFRILTEGSDPVSLAVGAYYIGAKSYNNQYYGASPYFVFCKQIGQARIHAGYQTNLLGVKETDTDNKKSRGIIVGIDGVIVKHEKRPLSMYVDYTGGPLATMGVGFFQPFNAKWSWNYSYYKPVKSELPISKTELAPQHWFGVAYTIPLDKPAEEPKSEEKPAEKTEKK